jgi:hypothetical protein
VELEFFRSFTKDLQTFLGLVRCECRNSFLLRALDSCGQAGDITTDLKDACFLLSNFSERVAQKALVIDAKRCDPSHNGLWDDVRTIVCATNSNFKNRRVDLNSK